MAKLNYDENLVQERTNNKNELNELEELLFYIEKCLKNESIKLENGEATVLFNNLTNYLGNRHKTIELREKELDQKLQQQFEENIPKTFM